MPKSMKYKRVLVKVSGERLGGEATSDAILDVASIQGIASEIKDIHDSGVEVGVVIGGGNILRGKEAAATGIDVAQAHQMGMLATVINALALQSVLEGVGLQTRVMSAVRVDTFCEPYIRRRAMRHLEKGRVVIFAGGTGNPFFTTDTAGALRAIEIGAEAYIKATKVDGIYTADPAKDPKARHLAEISYKDVLVDDLQVMDGAAIALCRDNGLPLMVCKVGTIGAALRGEAVFTVVK